LFRCRTRAPECGQPSKPAAFKIKTATFSATAQNQQHLLIRGFNRHPAAERLTGLQHFDRRQRQDRERRFP
jgi:hypothetical protein